LQKQIEALKQQLSENKSPLIQGLTSDQIMVLEKIVEQMRQGKGII